MTNYDTDLLLWSEHQSTLLRRRAAGELDVLQAAQPAPRESLFPILTLSHAA